MRHWRQRSESSGAGTAPAFRLRFPATAIARWAARYPSESDQRVEHEIAPAARRRGYLTRGELVELCRWKTPRSQPLVKRNPADLVEAATRAALASRRDDVKINLLRLLRGVSWPTASVILHFCDRAPYPILDVRALWSLGYATPPVYDVTFWQAYVDFTRALARESGLSMRALDRALWQYSAERQS